MVKKQYTRKKIKIKKIGGLKQKDTSISSWQSVYKMICVPGAILSKISYSSLNGFIFKLDIPENPEYSEFFGLNDTKTALTKPIYSLVFKFIIISDTDIEELPKIKGKSKITELQKNVLDEAFIQQEIYKTTLSPNGNPITISVVDFSYFNTDATKILINKLKECDNKENPDVVLMLDYILDNVKDNRKLGLITMELANSDFLELYDVYNDNYDAYRVDIKYAIAQLLILFIKMKIINYDCHHSNVLASTLPESKEKSILIDFGRVVVLQEDNTFQPNGKSRFTDAEWSNIVRRYLRASQSDNNNYQRDIRLLKQIQITDLYKTSNDSEDEYDIIYKMSSIIRFIGSLDYAINKTLFGIESPQMKDILSYIYGDYDWTSTDPNWSITMNKRTEPIYKKIIPIFYSLTVTPMQQRNLVSQAAIKKRVEDKEILTIDPSNDYDRSMDMINPADANPADTKIDKTVDEKEVQADASSSTGIFGKIGNFFFRKGGKSRKRKIKSKKYIKYIKTRKYIRRKKYKNI